MDYKEKYNAALERAKEMCAMPTDKATMEYIFPELKECEDDKNKRISKEITQFLKQNNGWNREWLAWLEKQNKTLDPDKVIEWLRQELPKSTWLPSVVIDKFKKDFGL